MIERDNIAIPLVAGLDTKTDPKIAQVGKLLVCENAIFEEHGTLKKRWGYNSLDSADLDGNSIENPQVLASWRDTPVMIADHNIYVKSATGQGWADHGRLNVMNAFTIDAPIIVAEQTEQDCISNGVITVYTWVDSRGGVYASATDSATGAILADQISVDSNGSRPRLGVSGGNVILFWVDAPNNRIETLSLVDTDTAGSLAGAPHVLTSALATPDLYDVVYDHNRDRTILAYLDATAGQGLKVIEIDQAGTATRTDTQDIATDYTLTVSNMAAISICSSYGDANLGDTYGFAVVTCASPGTSGCITRYSYDDVAFVSGHAYATSDATNGVTNLAITYKGYEDTTGDNLVVVDHDNTRVRVETVTAAAGTVTFQYEKFRSFLASRAILHDDRVWVMIGINSGGPVLQDTAFLYDIINNEPAARIQYGLYADEQSKSQLPGMWVDTDGSVQYAGLTKRRISDFSIALDPDAEDSGSFQHLAVTHQRFVIGAAANIEWWEANGTLYISSGILYAFSGGPPVEASPLTFPEQWITADFGNGAAGNLEANATYLYRVYYEIDRPGGDVSRSLSLTYAHTMGASNTKVSISLRTLVHTIAGSDARIAVYRTEANQTDIFYLVSSPDITAPAGDNEYVQNDPTSLTISFSDNMTDANLVKNKRCPQSEGVLPVVAPSSATIAAEAGDRVYLAGGDRRKGIVSPSLLVFPGEAVLFADELQIYVGEEGGDITAMGAIDDVLVVFKERMTYAVSGAGPDDTGGSTGAFNPQRVTTDVGCTAPGSVVETPKGLMFQSAKGFYILTRSFETEYIGWPVESFNDSVVVSAKVIPDTNLVVFLTSSGSSIAYDYFFDQWTVFTGHSGLDSVVSAGEYHYLRSDGKLYTRDRSRHLDGGAWYALRVRTAPIRLDSIQGYLRVRRVNIVGEYLSSHRLQMKVYCNRDISPTETRIWEPDDVLDLTLWGAGSGTWGSVSGTWGGAPGANDYQLQHKFKRQKVQTVSLEFKDLKESGSGESYQLTELNFSIGKYGENARIPAARKL